MTPEEIYQEIKDLEKVTQNDLISRWYLAGNLMARAKIGFPRDLEQVSGGRGDLMRAALMGYEDAKVMNNYEP